MECDDTRRDAEDAGRAGGDAVGERLDSSGCVSYHLGLQAA
jgi:hypothetical protein